MDFVVGLLCTRRQYDSIFVIVYRMTKSDHFIPFKVSYSAEYYAKLCIEEFVRHHEVPLSIISDRGTHFTTTFFKAFEIGLGKSVKLSATFHNQMDSEVKHTIKTLEDMLRA